MYQPWLAGACMAVDGKSFPSPAGNARGEPFIRDEGLAGHLQSGMEQQAQAAVRAHGESMAERIIGLVGAALELPRSMEELAA